MKKILAVAIASAFAAPAFAATANVDVYGQINLSVENVDNGIDDYNRMVTNNNSFIGFKGSEDLGSGMKAVWQIESNIEMTGNAATSKANTGAENNIFGTRNTFIGLAGGFGTVIAGTHDTPYKLSTGPLDIFVGTLGDYNGIFGSAGATSNSTLFDLRTGNTIAYLSPNFGGFDVKAAYVMGLEGVEAVGSDRSSAYSLSGTYKNGPLFATAAYEKHNSVGSTATCMAGATCLTEGTLDRDAWKIGAGYTFGNFKFGAVYESMDGDGALGVIEHDTWGLNGAYTMGAMTFKASYATADDLNGAANTGTDMWALGLDYTMSKRTKVQLTYAKQDNDSSGVWGLGQGASVSQGSGATGEAVDGFSLGMVHSF